MKRKLKIRMKRKLQRNLQLQRNLKLTLLEYQQTMSLMQ
jgi:hypothetical protein